jgi:hypothetical protein
LANPKARRRKKKETNRAPNLAIIGSNLKDRKIKLFTLGGLVSVVSKGQHTIVRSMENFLLLFSSLLF